MSSYAPIVLRVIDQNGSELFKESVPYEWEIDVKQVMERAFVLDQNSGTPDPLSFTISYYGYSQTANFPGYLGYEIETIHGMASNSQYYWELLINGVPSTVGADSMQPSPGSDVLWQYTAVPADPSTLAARTREIHSRRAARRKLKTG